MTKMTSVKFAFGVLMLGMTGGLMAQTNGEIRGTVVDPTGALVPQAQVTVSGANGFSMTLKSDDEGSFEVPGLAGGSYSISVSAAGFTPALEGVAVGSGVTAEQIKLGISVEQEVSVYADAQ